MLAPPPAFAIRSATSQDGPAAGRVVMLTWMSAYEHIFGPSQIVRVFSGRVSFALPWVAERLHEFGSWVAARDGLVIGSAGLHLRRDGEAELSHLYVLDEHQGCGVGSALLATCCESLREQACPALRLWVLERTPAVTFYLRHNAVVLARTVTRIDAQAEPTLCMRIRL
jgi:GNAT superfamily N-acetyltransferase